MALNESQQQTLKNWMRSKAIVQCPACGDNRWRFTEASYVRALLEAGDEDLTEDAGVVKLPCGNCGYMALFDGETVGIRGMWARGGTYNVSGDGPSGERTTPYRLFLGPGDDFSPRCLPSQRA